MKMGGGVVLIAAGLLVLWLAVTGRLSNAGAAWRTLNGSTDDLASGAAPDPVTPGGGGDWAQYLGIPSNVLSQFPARQTAWTN